MKVQGSVVSEVRRLTDSECQDIGLPVDNLGNTYALVLDSDSILFPVSDRAMNSQGGWRGDTNRIKKLESEKIKSLSLMSDEYMDYLNWTNKISEKPIVLEFSDDKNIYPSKDSEGNGPGLLFGYNDQTYEIILD